MPPEIIVCDVYGRKSTEDRAKSIASQIDVCRDEILRQSSDRALWQVGEVYQDEEISASRFNKGKARPDFEALMTSLEKYQPDGKTRRALAVWECSRGSRKISEWSNMMELCRDKGVVILVGSRGKVLNPRDTWDFEQLIRSGLDAHVESEITSERCLRGQRAAAHAGRPGGRLAYGYQRVYSDRGHYVDQVPHPEQAPIVAEIYRRIASGDSMHAIADDLNRRPVPPPAGNAWYLSRIRTIALSPTYLGHRVHHGEIVATNCWTPLVDEVTHRKVSRILKDPSRRTARHHVLRYFLSGALMCGKCGGATSSKWALWPPSPDPVRLYMCRRCGVSMRADWAEKYVLDMLRARLTAAEGVELFAAPSTDSEIVKAREEEERLQAQLDDTMDAAVRGEISPAMLGKMEQRLMPLIDAARKRQEIPVPVTEVVDLGPERVLKHWDALSVAHQREAVQLYIERLELAPKTTRGRTGFDRSRLGQSKWRGDSRTWAEIEAAAKGLLASGDGT